MAEALPVGTSSKATTGGYNVGGATVYNKHGPLKPSDLASLTCSRCNMILREPHQVTSCGHRYCKVCIDQLRSESKGPYVCPVDGIEYQTQQVYYDKGCWKEIQELEVDCPAPCPWKGKLTEMEVHLGVCPNKVLTCSNGCGGHFDGDKLEDHMTSECPMRHQMKITKMEHEMNMQEELKRMKLEIMTLKNMLHGFEGFETAFEHHIEKTHEEIQDVKIQNALSIVSLRRDVDQNSNSLTQYAIAIEHLQLRQDVLDVKTTDGIFIWEIPDISRRYRDAVDKKTVSLYSPPFYTSPHGYRICIRTYLNGDGTGKGTHISVFFFIMRSEHDNLLPWPFKQSVRFTLMNQKNPAASISEAFYPDLQSPSFQKPEYDMNIASGFPKFVRQSVLQDENFTKDNTLYIKCQVDRSGHPTI